MKNQTMLKYQNLALDFKIQNTISQILSFLNNIAITMKSEWSAIVTVVKEGCSEETETPQTLFHFKRQ